jgi:hypothetical protein
MIQTLKLVFNLILNTLNARVIIHLKIKYAYVSFLKA